MSDVNSGGDDHKKPKLTVVSSQPEENTLSQSEDNHEAAVNDEGVMIRVQDLEQEHRDLDQAIATMEERMPYDRLTLQRMKKRKLALKDRISKLKGDVTPDIIA
ncbi:YdcH family protein [Parvularcula sp. IMCC14364]|uniref:YdcH family protein n=1 Tax=Parvularcula sp. IMCC14364 TaxID=3067902 RepID=UPI00274295E1|nr:YdcH family protein [Parvularcula sp. IMCC14364]